MNLRLNSQRLVDRLFARINYERQSKTCPSDFKLANMVQFLQKLGNPQNAFPVVHVAGTKGKGSVSAMIGAICSAAGLKTGVYSSPHLERIHQRIRINAAEVSDVKLNQALAKLMPTIDDFDSMAERDGSKKLTFFEVITATACQVFADEQADMVVLEVGMGGRLDSTNVCQPEICVITNVSLDHTRQLGNTVEKIAFEKAGIIKPGVPVVSGVTTPEAAKVVRKVADQRGAPLFEMGRDFHCQVDNDTNQLSYQSDGLSLSNLELGMFGVHQKINATVAIAVIDKLLQSKWDVNETSIRAGLRSASLPGRCEVVSGPSLVVMDMAHNAASMQALAETLSDDVEGFSTAGKKTLLVAISREKELVDMLHPVIDLFDSFVVTRYVDNPRARSCSEIADCLRTLLRKKGRSMDCLTVIEDPQVAWRSVIEADVQNHAICISGSVFLVAELRPIVRKWADNC